ncbi:transcriptional regulator GcvA [Agrobacterium sp. SHOUNA12C]|uniref:transcriptional regulator GcvA n=1 Tax=Rhizobium rhizogenes TaxID=359 RepID=UPI00123B0E93|nr:transcriptional regulator GcvA [Rhizobium rhizogenes]KAA6488614.1 transcriptional regulator GcvA [Agrobacterium sp. ICMP 7243]MCJ9721186.1 transcriptional regulator GcvA [Agrobacterium sp. BETTINA12B]MCJ9756253.1 transcriptional regulator GcvA [Agrobacterium sp. SHOUNA12C]NTF52229.1 transcriptional regulator GcvA [Rhizobium rhizogenes]NTG17773.1 transcriptional regulator GcvA [Rhizobium rhizogenes]
MNERPFGTNVLGEAIEIATNEAVPTAPQDCQPSGGSGRRMNRLPPLNLFRVFEAAARHGSFTAAADELCVTQSAVSQQIRQIEDLLDVRLFRRLPRRVELTREGTQLASAVHESLALLARACERIVDPMAPTVLCINAPPAIASRWLVPRLKRFMQLNPQIKVTLLASNDTVNFDRQDIDVAIRWGRGDWQGARVERLGPDKLFPVCSPSVLREGPPIVSPGDLARHTLLQNMNSSLWATWFATAGVGSVNFDETLYFNDAGLLLDAAVQGQGIALANHMLVENDLKTGRLIRPFNIEIQSGESYHILTSPDFSEKAAVAEFRQWIRAEGAEAG